MMEKIPLPTQFDRTGRDLGFEEVRNLVDVIESGCLICTRGKYTPMLEKDFAELYGVPHARALASGSAAVHVALAAVNPGLGDEIITTPVTDFGALAPIIFQGAIPVFADVDPHSLNVTPETIKARITPHTKAVIVAHLFGTAADIEGILAVCEPLGIPVIEDVAQAFLAHQNGKMLGTMGYAGCFSFQQGKQMTTGEGGIVITNDEDVNRRMWLFTNKGWGYRDPGPDHWMLALNYRITELQSAVAHAQLGKLPRLIARRQEAAAYLTKLLEGLEGVRLPKILPGCDHTYWRYTMNIDPKVVPGGSRALGKWLMEHDLPANAGYIGRPSYKLKVFQDKVTFGNSGFPWNVPQVDSQSSPQARGEWDDADFPGCFEGLANIVVLPWNEFYERKHVEFIADRIENGIKALRQQGPKDDDGKPLSQAWRSHA